MSTSYNWNDHQQRSKVRARVNPATRPSNAGQYTMPADRPRGGISISGSQAWSTKRRNAKITLPAVSLIDKREV